MIVLLETERLILRQFTEDDEDNLFELNSDPEVVRFFPHVKVDRKQVQNFIQTNFTHYEEYEGYGFWAVIEKISNKFIGWFQFTPCKYSPNFDPTIANPDDIELGYRFQKETWGKGYATEGGKALIFKGFNELLVPRILAGAVTENKASIRVMEKIGLKFQTNVFNKRLGQDASIYSLRKDEYK